MINEEELRHFKSVCGQEFQFLIEEFGFVPEPIPSGEFVNQFQFRLTNEIVSLVVEGINYGENADIRLQDKHGRSVGISCLLPGWEPFTKQKKGKRKKQLSQDKQIALAARQLKEHGQDILLGEFERFNKIGDRMNSTKRLLGNN